jgi:hypothetical protein
MQIMNNLKLNGMNISINNFDSIDTLIYDEGLRIETIDIHPNLDLMLVILNTKAVLHQQLSKYPNLNAQEADALLKYELIGGGTGVHWPMLDEDLSLKGFLQDELKNVVYNNLPIKH